MEKKRAKAEKMAPEAKGERNVTIYFTNGKKMTIRINLICEVTADGSLTFRNSEYGITMAFAPGTWKSFNVDMNTATA